MNPPIFPTAVVSVIKHGYVARGIASHPRFRLTVVTDDESIPDWAHERNQEFADEFQIPYRPNLEKAFREFAPKVAVVSPEAHRHCDLSVRAAELGMHVVQDKPLALQRSEAERLVRTIHHQRVHFMMWNRNFLPSILHGIEKIRAGAIGEVLAIHADFYFAKDAGPPKRGRKLGYPPMDWLTHQIAAHIDGSDGGIGPQPIGELANEGIYPLGFILAISDAHVRKVYARSASHFHQLNADNNVEDLASMTLEMDRGIVGSVSLGRIGLASHPSGGEIKLRIVGSEGAMVLHEARPEVGIYYRNQPPGEARQRRVAIENDFLLAEHFATSLDRDIPPWMNIDDSFHVFATVEAALNSCKSGQPECVLPRTENLLVRGSS